MLFKMKQKTIQWVPQGRPCALGISGGLAKHPTYFLKEEIRKCINNSGHLPHYLKWNALQRGVKLFNIT